MPSIPSSGREQGDSSSSDGNEAGRDSRSGEQGYEPGGSSGSEGWEDEGGLPGEETAGDPGEQAAGNEATESDANDTAEAGPESDDVDFSEEDPSSAASASSAEENSSPSNAEGGGSASSSSSAPPNEPAMSDQERQVSLEGELDESMSTYDGMILRERDYILNRNNERGSEEELETADAGGGKPYDEDLGDEQTAGGATSSSPYESDASGGGNRPAEPGSGREGDYQHKGQSAPPADIPDGNDDDVVARQIREAAMRETDPELREKLWEEYRKYKNQSKNN